VRGRTLLVLGGAAAVLLLIALAVLLSGDPEEPGAAAEAGARAEAAPGDGVGTGSAPEAAGTGGPEGAGPRDAGPAPPAPQHGAGGGRSTAEIDRHLDVEREILSAARRRLAAAGVPQEDIDEAPRGHLDAEYIRQSIREIAPLIEECYELALEETPALEGRLVAEFSIVGEPEVGGIVERSEVLAESTLSSPTLNECVRQTIYTVELEPPEGGGRVDVRYPFIFRRGDERDEEREGI